MKDASAPRVAASGFREYDARWRYPDDVDLAGMVEVGLGLGTQMHIHRLPPRIVVGHDYRAYSEAVKAALVNGLRQAGVHVLDIGMALSPMAYFAQIHLDAPAVAMVTASHNPNGWTGLKIGFDAPLTHGPDQMAELRDIVLGGHGVPRPGGGAKTVDGLRDAYLDDLVGDVRMTRPLRAVCATGNGTASAFAPDVLRRIGVEVIERHTTLDHSFPHYNPNPEAMEMLHDMADAVRESGADIAFGFDGDGDRCGVVDAAGQEVFSDLLGLILARDLVAQHPAATFVVDVKSTGLWVDDPVLRAAQAKVDVWKTGHSHMKRRVHDLKALAGFEKSGHAIFAPPLGRGYDCALRLAVEVCKMLDRAPGRTLADLRADLPPVWTTPTLSPALPDAEKYAAVDRITERLQDMVGQGRIAGHRVTQVNTINGARVQLDHGGWALVRASSNTPNLVIVCESPASDADLRAIFSEVDAIVRAEAKIGPYDQTW